MRRLFAIFLICLLPLQSFASVGMGVKMAGMDAQLSAAMKIDTAAQMPCHTTSQTEQVANEDCCGLEGMCRVMCHLNLAVQPASVFAINGQPHLLQFQLTAHFQSADVQAGFKPPLL